MAKLLKLRRGTTSQHSSFTGAEGEVTVDTTKDTIVVHDGSTAGGTPLAKESDNLSLIDEDNMSTNSATRPPSQQSVKAYVDALPDVIDEDNFASNSATRPPSQQSVKAYVDALPDVIDEDNLVTDSATRPPSQQSVKAYVDALPDVIDEDNMSSNSATRPPSQQSAKAYVDTTVAAHLVDEDNFASDSATKPPSQQSVKAYIQTVSAADALTYAQINNTNLTGTATGVNLTLSGNLTVNGSTTTIDSTTLNVEDKNIELGKVSTPTDTTADGGGITLKGATDKTITWVDATDAWTFNQDIEVTSGDIKIVGGESQPANLLLYADEGDDNADKWRIRTETSGNLNIQNYAAGSWGTAITGIGNGAIEIRHANTKVFETTAAGVTVTGSVTDSKGNLRSIPQNAKSSAYTLVAADAGKHVLISSGGVTVPDNVFSGSGGDAITIINNSGSDQTITQGSGVTMYNTADASTGNRTLAARGMCTLLYTAVDNVYVSGSGLS